MSSSFQLHANGKRFFSKLALNFPDFAIYAKHRRACAYAASICHARKLGREEREEREERGRERRERGEREERERRERAVDGAGEYFE